MSALSVQFERRLGNSVGLVVTIALHGVVLALILSSRHETPYQIMPLTAKIISDAPTAEPKSEPLRAEPVLERPKLNIPQPEIMLNDPAPSPTAPVAVAVPAVSAPAAAEPRQTVDAVPRFDADYLNNPAPSYPRVSRRLREQGTVMLRVYVSPNGAPEVIELKASSGFLRLDESALDAVRRWKFLPAQSAGRSIGAWVIVPIAFSLNA